MSLYNVLWVDDDWFGDGEKDDTYLNKVLNRIIIGVKNENIVLNFIKVQRPEEGVVEIRQGIDFRLVILDLRYSDTRFNIDPIIREADEKKISYTIYTHFKEKVEREAKIRNKDFLLGAYQKGVDDSEFIGRVISFFKAPPFRILHLSDYHFCADPQSAGYEEQELLLMSMNKKVKEEHQKSPIDAVFITGDFASKNPMSDLIGIRRYLYDLVENTITTENINKLFVVPGNHDIQWEDYVGKKIGDNALSPYYDLYRYLYVNRLSILNEMIAWDSRRNDFKSYSDICGTSWFRQLYDPVVSVIGISTPTLKVIKQGKGAFLREHQEYIERMWGNDKHVGEVRIALMHHNIFSSLSLSGADEKTMMNNAGDALYTLLKHKCSLVLTGHTHSPGILSCKASSIRFKGYDEPKQILIISSGTVGGFHPAGDRPRSFNVIDVLDEDKDNESRKVCIRPFVYESAHHEWSEGAYTTYEI